MKHNLKLTQYLLLLLIIATSVTADMSIRRNLV